MRFSKYFIASFTLLVFFSACKKNSDSIDLSPNFYFLNGGASDTSQTLLLFSSSDTASYNVVISSTYFLTSSTLVTIGVEDDYRNSFNSTYGSNYQPMPTGAYSFSDTITATPTYLYDTIKVNIYKHALLSGTRYMLPLKILSAGNYKIDTSASILYLRSVNDLLSGIYSSFVKRTMYNGDAADNSVNSIDTFTIVKPLTPSISGSALLDYADLGANGWQYVTGFAADGGSFFALPNNVINSSVETNSFKVLSSNFNETTKDIYLKTSYKNTSGNERVIEETLKLK